MNKSAIRRSAGVVCGLAALGLAQGAAASLETWSGSAGDNNWSSNLNWSGIGGAGADDDLEFPVSASRKTNTNDFPVNTNFNSLTFSGGGYVINGNQIFLTAGLTSNVSSGVGAVFNPGMVIAANSGFTCSNVQPFTMNGVLNLNGKTLTLGGSGTCIFNGAVNTSNLGTGTLVKGGAGLAVIEGNAEATDVKLKASAGDLRINNSARVIDLIGGRLSGSGPVQGIVAFGLGGQIAPGDANPGNLVSTGAVAMGSSVDFVVRLNGTVAGTGYDRLFVSGGNVSLNGANLIVSLGFTPTTGSTFSIVQCTGCAVAGQFVQGDSITAGGKTFSITYTANSVFLTTLAPTDLTISKTHAGSFTQGQVGAEYSLVVSNIGGVSSSGTVTVTDTLPTGLTATGIAGTGWTCTQPSGPCTRGNVLPAGASFPPLTLTVNVAANAPASVTNTATVAGGNDSNGANNSSSDPTTVAPSGPAVALVVNKNGSGGGTVSSTDTFIDCLPTCTHNYTVGTVVTLNAVASADSKFTGWLGPCTGTGACIVTMSAAKTVSATFATNISVPQAPFIDIDVNDRYDALTDGVLAMRSLLGLTSTALATGAIGPSAFRTDPAILTSFLSDIRPLLDVDGNGVADPATDGLLILRYLFGLRGADLIAGAIGAGATRTSSTAIEDYMFTTLAPP